MAADLHEELARYAIGKGVTPSRAVRDLIENQKGQSPAQLGRWFFR
jgi:ribosomal protein S16